MGGGGAGGSRAGCNRTVEFGGHPSNARQRPPRRHEPRQHRPHGRGRGLLRRRLAQRGQRPLGLRAPLRAHDVSGVGQRRQGRALQSDHQSRRKRQRNDEQRPYELLRNAPLERARARIVARSRPNAIAGDHAGQLREPADDRHGGATAADRQSAVHPQHAAHQRAGLRRLLAVRTLDHRGHARPDRRPPRSRPRVLRYTLRPQQCGAEHQSETSTRPRRSRWSSSTSGASQRGKRRPSNLRR